MSVLDDLAAKLSGNTRAEENTVITDATTRTYIGTATTDSADGSVYISLGEDVTMPDDYDGSQGTGVEMPTTVAVKEGDEVIVTTIGGSTMKAPVVTGNPGWGDDVETRVTEAHDSAETAKQVAQEAEAEVAKVRQDVADFKGNVYTKAQTDKKVQDLDDAISTELTTNYTNNNDLATTYATKTLVSQTKDAIELAASQTYETQSDAAATYATQSALTVGLDGIRSEVAEDYQPKGDYATTASMNSAIQQSASSIESSVAATYETKSDAAATYATKTEVQQTASGLDTRITTAQSTADGAASTAQAEVTERQTLVRQFSGGVLAGYVGNSVTALMNAAGSFDVVQTTWSDGTPTVTDTLASFDSQEINIGPLRISTIQSGGGSPAGFVYSDPVAIGSYIDSSSGEVMGGFWSESTEPSIVGKSLTLMPVELASGVPKPGTPATFDMDNVITALRKANSLMPSTFALWAGTKVLTVSNASTFVLFTKAQLQAIVGTSWTPTGSNCAVFVTNGDYGVTDALMTASIDASSVVRVHLNKTRNGPVRINYLIIRFA